jgi:hypothetical protein
MNTHDLFQKFNETIKLDTVKKESLETSRGALRKKINKYFDDNSWNKPIFKSQGSFDLNTIINPLNGKYDLDDGVYYTCSFQDRKTTATYHNRIVNAVDGHASSVVDKNTCVRVVFADGHHIDLPSYWKENSYSTPQLAHKTEGFIESDPEAFKKWLNDKISVSNKTGQLKRLIRYFKAWKDYREYSNSSVKLPSGFILTILACDNFKENVQDDISLKETLEAIYYSLSLSFVCYRPTIPMYEDLLSNYDKKTVLDEFGKFLSIAEEALEAESKNKSSEKWRKVFGDRFPLADDKNKTNIFNVNTGTRTGINFPWNQN